MRISTVIMTSIVGGIIGATLGRAIGIIPTMSIAFILGSIIGYVNEKYLKWD